MHLFFGGSTISMPCFCFKVGKDSSVSLTDIFLYDTMLLHYGSDGLQYLIQVWICGTVQEPGQVQHSPPSCWFGPVKLFRNTSY